MSVMTRQPLIEDFDREDLMFLLRTPTGEGYVKISQAVGFTGSRVTVQDIVSGDLGATVGEALDVLNTSLEVVIGRIVEVS